MEFREILESQLSIEKEYLEFLESIVASSIDGNLVIKMRKGHKYYYREMTERGEHTLIPIPRDWTGAPELIHELASRAVATRALRQQKRNVRALESCCRNYLECPVECYPYHEVAGQELFPQGRVFEQEWKKSAYIKNPYRVEDCIYQTAGDDYVRSKSEVMIADTLFSQGLSYRYECVLETPDQILYPDFSIINPNSHHLVLWEHLGLLHIESYVEHALRKICIYARQGYYPGDNLILTWETSEHPLTRDRILVAMREVGLAE